MKIGVCSSLDSLETVQKAGYDYLEGGFGSLLQEDNDTFRAHRHMVEVSGFAVETFNGFLPWNSLYTPDYDFRALADYVERGMERAVSVGGKIVVLGSAGARNIPAEVTRSEAEARFAEVLAVAGEVALRYGMQIAVEPLREAECNFIHTVREGVEMAHRSGCAAVGGLVDFYHFFANGDDLGSFDEVGGSIIHAHLARPDLNRDAPYAEDAPMLAAWADALRKCPRLSRISLECVFSPSFEEAIERAYPLMDVFRNIPIQSEGTEKS